MAERHERKQQLTLGLLYIYIFFFFFAEGEAGNGRSKHRGLTWSVGDTIKKQTTRSGETNFLPLITVKHTVTTDERNIFISFVT